MALPDTISVDDLFAPPRRSGATISPDGTRIAFLAPWKDRLNVWVQDLDPDAAPRCVTADETRSVLTFRWTDDPRWLLYQQDQGGDENWHLYRVDLDDPDAPAVDLTPFPGARAVGIELPPSRPGRAVLHLTRDRRTGELLGVRYLGERQVVRALDADFAAVLENLEALSDGDLADLSSDVDGRWWVVSFTHDRDPGATWLLSASPTWRTSCGPSRTS